MKMSHRSWLSGELVVRVDRRTAALALAGAILTGAALRLSSESLSLTTTYPSPLGIYARLIATGRGPSGPVDTLLSRDQGTVVIGQGANPSGAKLHVSGDVWVTGRVTGAPVEGAVYAP